MYVNVASPLCCAHGESSCLYTLQVSCFMISSLQRPSFGATVHPLESRNSAAHSKSAGPCNEGHHKLTIRDANIASVEAIS